jgi:hypothetical protein
MQLIIISPSIRSTHMKKCFTAIFLILLSTTGAEQVFGENPIKYPGKLDIKFSDSLSANLMSLYHPVDTFDLVSRIWKLQLENQRIDNQDGSRARSILNLGSVPDASLKYQSDAVLQWGYSFRGLFLLLRIGVKVEDFNYLDFQPRRENNHPIYQNLNPNFLIDFWLK